MHLDLEAFESDLRAIISAIEIGKNTAFVSDLLPNASGPQSGGELSDRDVRGGRRLRPILLAR